MKLQKFQTYNPYEIWWTTCYLNFTFKTSHEFFLNFKKSIRAHVRYRTFATLQIELHCIVDYDSKWSTKFHTPETNSRSSNCLFKTHMQTSSQFRKPSSPLKPKHQKYKTSHQCAPIGCTMQKVGSLH